MSDCGCPRFMLAAPKSGSGKTMMTCGLLQALKNRGLKCRSFKCGPDYIDPMFHKTVLGIEGGNLDTFFLSKEEAAKHFADVAAAADISVIEGVMGYYDGVGGTDIQASSYEVALATESTVVLVLDCRGASLSLAAVAKGFLEFKKDSHIKGVILNRISPLMAQRLKPEFERLGITVYGYLPECQAAGVLSRHLGLVLPEEIGTMREQMEALACEIEKTVDVDRLIKLAMGAGKPISRGRYPDREPDSIRSTVSVPVKIGIARNEAFCFYYQENIKLLEELGAELQEFDPIRDDHLPAGISGLILGGGYPELYAKELSENRSILKMIRESVENGMPLLAECGGFLYLHEELETKEGDCYPMAGVIAGRAYPTGKLSRFGYVELHSQEDGVFIKNGETIRGHEFHYWDSTNCGAGMRAVKPGGQRSWDCMHMEANLLAGFPHLYYPSNPAVVRRWIMQCRQYR